MKWRVPLLTAVLLFAAAAFAQTDNTIYVRNFAGATVGAKVSAAQVTCGPNTMVPCILVIDPSLAAWATGTMPTLCSHCYLWDFRSGPPSGGGGGSLPDTTEILAGNGSGGATASGVYPPSGTPGAGLAAIATDSAGHTHWQSPNVVASGSGTPQGVTCSFGQVYQQNVSSNVSQQWNCSQTGLNWVNQTTGAVVYASSTHVSASCVLWWDMQQTSGTTVTDSCGSNNGTITNGSGISWNGAPNYGLAFASGQPGYVTMPASSLQAGYTYQVCVNQAGTPPASGEAALFGSATGSGVMGSLGFDSNGYPIGNDTGNNGVPNINGFNQASVPAYPTCFTYLLDNSGGAEIYDGTQATPTMVSTAVPTFGSSVTLGGSSGNAYWGYDGIIYSAHVWSAELTAEQIQHEAALENADLSTRGLTMQNAWEPYGSNTSILYAALGDSLTIQPYFRGQGFPGTLASNLGNNFNQMNLAVGSATCTNLGIQDVAAANLSKYFSSPMKVATVLIGTNDVSNSTWAATEFACLATHVAALHAAGYKVIGLTIPQKGTVNSNYTCSGTCETQRLLFNSMITGSTIFDGIVDLATDPRFYNSALASAYYGNFYYTDGIHFNQAGYEAIAGRLLTELNRMGITNLGAGNTIVQVPYSATPVFDLSQGLHQSMLLTGNVSSFTVINGNGLTNFQIDFIQDSTGGRTVGLGVVGSGATATTSLSGSTPVFTLTSGGSNYKTAYPPQVVLATSTCTAGDYPGWQSVTVSGGAVTATSGIGGTCSAVGAPTFVSTEPAWSGPSSLAVTTANSTTSLFGSFNATASQINYTINPAASSGSSIGYYKNALASNVGIGSTFVTGPSVSVPAGTYYVSGTVSFNTSGNWDCILTDTAGTVIASVGIPNQGGPSALSGVAVESGSTTLSLQCEGLSGSTGAMASSVWNSSPATVNATQITALKIQ